MSKVEVNRFSRFEGRKFPEPDLTLIADGSDESLAAFDRLYDSRLRFRVTPPDKNSSTLPLLTLRSGFVEGVQDIGEFAGILADTRDTAVAQIRAYRPDLLVGADPEFKDWALNQIKIQLEQARSAMETIAGKKIPSRYRVQ